MIKGIIKDIKTLGHIIKCIFTGKPIIKQEKWEALKDDFKTTSWKDEFKKTAPWLLAILFAVFIGLFIGAKYYELQCNNFIIDNYIKPQMQRAPNPYGFNYTLDLPTGTPSVTEFPEHDPDQYS